eukprot:755834-Rhodomonas_salina.1
MQDNLFSAFGFLLGRCGNTVAEVMRKDAAGRTGEGTGRRGQQQQEHLECATRFTLFRHACLGAVWSEQ